MIDPKKKMIESSSIKNRLHMNNKRYVSKLMKRRGHF
jgi:hypothetical protein